MDLGLLLDRARAGDHAAWNTLLTHLRPFIHALLRRQLAQDADASDLTQQVQQRMAAGLGQFRGETVPQLLAWIRQIAARVLIDHRRALTPPPAPLPPDVAAPGSTAEPEQLPRLAAALERLPEPYRQVIEARFLDGLKCVDIARKLGRSDVWVRVTCKRALEQLRQALGDRP